jgi:hypothetical protein
MLSVYGALEHPPPIVNGGIVSEQVTTAPPAECDVPEEPVEELPEPDTVTGPTKGIANVADAAPEPVEAEPEPVAALPADVESLG